MAAESDFTLDTGHMSETAKDCETLYKQLRDLRNKLNSTKDSLMFTWAGKGRNEFEKQYHLLCRQFSDIIDDTKDMYEKIIAAEEAYIQADTDNAKTMDGIDRKI